MRGGRSSRRLRGGCRFFQRRADRDVGAHFFQFRFGDAANDEQVGDALEAARLGAEFDDGFRGGRADSGELFELLDRRAVDVDWMRGRSLLSEGGAGKSE